MRKDAGISQDVNMQADSALDRPTSKPVQAPYSAKATLNSQQEKAVAGATAGGAGITLIQGPPGTGKTHCALRIIMVWLEKRRNELRHIAKQRRERVTKVEGTRTLLPPRSPRKLDHCLTL